MSFFIQIRYRKSENEWSFTKWNIYVHENVNFIQRTKITF